MPNKKLIITIEVIIFFCIAGIIFIIFNGEKMQDKVILPSDNSESEIKQDDENSGMNQEAMNILKNVEDEEINSVRSIDDSDHIIGELGAPVEVVVYNNFDCPFFSEMNETMNQVRDEFGNKVVIAFRHFPMIIHTNSMIASLASECASEQDKFWEMYEKLSKDNELKRINENQFKKDAENIDLDIDEFSECFYKERYKEKIIEQMEEGQSANVVGAPTTFVNGQQLPGAYPFFDFIRENGEEILGIKSVIERYLQE